MKEFEIVISIASTLVRIIIILVGLYIVLSTGPDRLFDDPLYAMVALIFFFLILSDKGDGRV